jgi:hypothetical protein
MKTYRPALALLAIVVLTALVVGLAFGFYSGR